MKRAWKLVSLALIVVLLLSVTALADGATETDKATITVVEGAGVTAAFDSANSEIINVTVTGANLTVGSQYVVLMVKSSDGENYTITSDSILYIDQTAATADGENGTVSFKVYPSSMQNSVILVSGTGLGGAEKVASVEVAYLTGDITTDNVISSADAVALNQHLAGITQLTGNGLLAADINHDGVVSAADAVKLNQYLAGIISELQ